MRFENISMNFFNRQSLFIAILGTASFSQAAIVLPTVANTTATPSVGTVARLTDNAELYDSGNTTTATTVNVNQGTTLALAQAAYSEWDDNGHGSGFAIAAASSGQYIVWDLGSDLILNNAILWKYGNRNGSPFHAMNQFTFQYNTSAQGATTFAAAPSIFNLGLATLGTSTTLGGQVTQAPQTFALSGQTVRYVKMALISNHSGDSTNLIAFNEIRFDAVPEPSSMALVGLAGCALLLRRRSRG